MIMLVIMAGNINDLVIVFMKKLVEWIVTTS